MAKPMLPIYSSFVYPPDHFSLENGCKAENWFVAAVRYKKGPCYLVKVNPTDSRGFRTIVRLIEKNISDMKNTLNRPYSLLEKQGLLHVMATVAHVYDECFKLVAQMEVAGNNAHDFRVCENKGDAKSDDKSTGPVFILGKQSEPIMLHGHITGRGHTEHIYFPSILPEQKLGGPRPGQPFNGRGDAHEPGPGGDTGNMSKNKWPSAAGGKEMKLFAAHLARCLRPFVLGDLEFISLT